MPFISQLKIFKRLHITAGQSPEALALVDKAQITTLVPCSPAVLSLLIQPITNSLRALANGLPINSDARVTHTHVRTRARTHVRTHYLRFSPFHNHLYPIHQEVLSSLFQIQIHKPSPLHFHCLHLVKATIISHLHVSILNTLRNLWEGGSCLTMVNPQAPRYIWQWLLLNNY